VSAIDTPDYQRGVVSAQKLLATVAAGTASVLVTPPPNCETLIVITETGTLANFVSCLGVTSGVLYPGSRTLSPGNNAFLPVFMFDVSDVIETELELSWQSSPPAAWYVYSDAGVHTVADVSSSKDLLGQQFVVPVIPYGRPGCHPPQELIILSAIEAANATLLPAPGAGLRYRIFGVTMAAAAAGLTGVVYDAGSGHGLLCCTGVGNSTSSFPSQGIAITDDNAVGYILLAGAGAMYICLQYTLETV